MEKFKYTMRLREAELQQARERQEFERYKLDLIKEGKILDPIAVGKGEPVAEKDPDTFFLLFERLAKNRKWSDSEQTLLLQCVLTDQVKGEVALAVRPALPVQGVQTRLSAETSKQPYKGFKPHLGYVSISKQEPLKLHCDLCSIVSSSGQMLGQAAVPEMDSSPCVWRMNNAPTRGFEDDVGQRTTLRVISHTSVPLLLQKPQYFFGQANDTVYVVCGPLRNMRKDGKGIVYNMLRQASENYLHARIYVTTEDRMNYCDMVFKKEIGKDRIQSGSYLSTGWFPLILSIDMCKEIHIYTTLKGSENVVADALSRALPA
ncbi:alpha-N-acetylgalactosaminide alpha-2,6-sialyltransferase 3-like [Cololabis saira]|uniref:alpha-N-acetylgalactosaminide alpha-2,6-sialyltransferase 3-like n=1 Tax=Cololabis saira TaxID=129043 RepID=UPI002AD44514|nr:alpha-N-acetylgalactosaminide alpha-2,6-sialyltransferase 3-like [Cololabis saira]